MGTAHGRRHLRTVACLEGVTLALVTVVVARTIVLVATVGILGGHIEQSTIQASAAVRSSVTSATLTRRIASGPTVAQAIRTFSLLRLAAVVPVAVRQRRLHVHPAIRLRRRH